MKDNPESIKARQAKLRTRRKADMRMVQVWVALKDLERVATVALQNGWISISGRNPGQPNIQYGVNALLRDGLEGRENGQIEAGKLRQIVESWQAECAGRESSPRFEKVAKLLAEISALLPPVASGEDAAGKD